MGPKLYYVDVSPFERSVLLTAKALGIELELIPLDIFAGEHKSPEYIKLNPQGTVLTLDDDGYILSESHAIITYLADKYGKNDDLYPKDLQIRNIINQRLHFNGGHVQPRMRLILRGLFLGEINEVLEDKAPYAICNILEAFLKDDDYMAGKNLTIADLSLVSTISCLDRIIPIDSKKCPKLRGWLSRMQKLSYYYEANLIRLDKYIKAIKNNLI